MIAGTEGEQEFDSHTVHVGHRQDAQRARKLGHVDTQVLLAEVYVAPQGAIGQHDALRKSRRPAGVVDHSQLLGTVLMPMHVFAAEGIGVLMAEQLVQPFAGIGEPFVMRYVEREVG